MGRLKLLSKVIVYSSIVLFYWLLCVKPQFFIAEALPELDSTRYLALYASIGTLLLSTTALDSSIAWSLWMLLQLAALYLVPVVNWRVLHLLFIASVGVCT